MHEKDSYEHEEILTHHIFISQLCTETMLLARIQVLKLHYEGALQHQTISATNSNLITWWTHVNYKIFFLFKNTLKYIVLDITVLNPSKNTKKKTSI